MKILLIGDFSPGSLELSYFNAFKNIGCEIHQLDLVKEYKLLNPLSGNYWGDRLLSGFFNRSINEKIPLAVNFYKPDIVFVIKGLNILPETLSKVKRQNEGLLINFNPDNPFNLNPTASNDLIRESIPIYDCCFIWGKFLIPLLKDAGAKYVEYLPFAYDPGLHYPVDVSDEGKKLYGSDIAFIGSWDKEREGWLSCLADFDLAIWGNSWNRLSMFSPLRKKWKGREVLGADFSKVCNSSKIILNLIRKQNENAHNMRTFEVPACGGFVLSNRTDDQIRFFPEDVAAVYFSTEEELLDKIYFYLKHEEKRKTIALKGLEIVQKHRYADRIQVIIDHYKQSRGD